MTPELPYPGPPPKPPDEPPPDWFKTLWQAVSRVAENLGPSVVGHFIKLRFRMASDNSVSAPG